MDFCRRSQAALNHPRLLVDKIQREKYVATIKQEEQQTLQQLYDPKPRNRGMTSQSSTNASLQEYIRELNTRRKAFQDTGKAVHGSALQEVEQEREVAFEVESVRQVKKPQQFAACSFPGLKQDLEMFAKTGRMPADSHYFTHVFSSLANTGLGRRFRVSSRVTESKLFVTAEFDRTIKHSIEKTMDNFLVSPIITHTVTLTLPFTLILDPILTSFYPPQRVLRMCSAYHVLIATCQLGSLEPSYRDCRHRHPRRSRGPDSNAPRPEARILDTSPHVRCSHYTKDAPVQRHELL
jgi:hypothetical protein